MSFKLCPILALPKASNGAEIETAAERVLSSAHIVEEDFTLVLLLTSHENIAIYNSTSSSCRQEFVPISRLYPRQKLQSRPALVALTEDASTVVVLLADSRTLLLLPFQALMDVTWGRRTAPLAPKPLVVSIMDSEASLQPDENRNHAEEDVEAMPSSAVCYHSTLSRRTFLLFGNAAGELFLVDLHIKRISVSVKLKCGISSLLVYRGENDGRKYLMVNQLDCSQMLLPLESGELNVRETFARMDSRDILVMDGQFQHFPRANSTAMAILARQTGSLKLFKSFKLDAKSNGQCNEEDEAVQLDALPTNVSSTVRDLLFTSHLVLILTAQSQLLVHLRFLQSNYKRASFSPLPVDSSAMPILGLIATNSPNSPLSSPHNNQPLDNFGPVLANQQRLDNVLVVAENGLHWLKSEKSLDGFIFEHLSTNFYSSKTLSTLAQCLRVDSSSLCLSLLRILLTSSTSTESKEHIERNIAAQVEGILSLALANNIEPNSLLSLLQEFGQSNLLIPFLKSKCERNPSDLGVRQLLLTTLLSKLSQISTETADDGPVFEAVQQMKPIEQELREFLIKYGLCERQNELLPILLRTSLWSCVFILLANEPEQYSPVIARHLLELSAWKGIPRLAGLLHCLAHLHWPSLDSSAPTLIIKLFNLVPCMTLGQLRSAESVANALMKRSIHSALSLKLVILMRLFGLLEHDGEDLPRHGQSAILTSGPNCSLVLAENLGIQAENEADCQLMFWGEFAAGATRMFGDGQQQKQKGSSTAVETGEASPQLKRRKEEQNQQQLDALEKDQGEGHSRERRSGFLAQKFPLVTIPTPLKHVQGVQICSVTAGTEHVLALSKEGRLFSFGQNRFGQCGLGHCWPVQALTEICGSWGKIVAIAAGHYHSALISEHSGVWLWGWGLYGQLGMGHIRNLALPTRSDGFSALGPIKSICLGHAHSLALTEDGRVFGTGATIHGQLGVDPATLDGPNPQKKLWPIQLPFPGPIGLLASGYFHGTALSVDGQQLFEWGECPQTLKMQMFLQKRLRSKEKEKQQNLDEKKEKMPEAEEDGEQAEDGKNANAIETKRMAMAPIEAPKEHLRIRRLCKWEGAPIKKLSAGFNHSALLTTKGELFTWGKALEMQLGHGERKEKAKPSLLANPMDVEWADVVCARNSTLALSAQGLVYVWGRNDRNQLGLGLVEKKKPTRKILLKSSEKAGGKAQQRAVELPADNCVERPRMLPGLKVPMPGEGAPEIGLKLAALLSTADQHSINALSRFLQRYPVTAFLAVHVHLMAGDLLPAVRLLPPLARREWLQAEEEGTEKCQILLPSTSTAREESGGSGGNCGTIRMGTLTLRTGGGKFGHCATETVVPPKKRTSTAAVPRRVSIQLRMTTARKPSPSSSQPAASFCSSSPAKLVQAVTGRAATPLGGGEYLQAVSGRSVTPPGGGRLQQLSNSSTPASSVTTSTPASASTASTPAISFTAPSSAPAYAASASSPARSATAPTPSPEANDVQQQFHALVDRVWALLRVHPILEVRTLAALELLQARLPIYNRLAADQRLCRLIEPFLGDHSGGGGLHFHELPVRERQSTLRKVPKTAVESRRFNTLKLRCDQMLAQDKFRYFNDCGHFEKCAIESGTLNSEMASQRNRMRRCTRCVNNSNRRMVMERAGDRQEEDEA